jgi:hypothetical protein
MIRMLAGFEVPHSIRAAGSLPSWSNGVKLTAAILEWQQRGEMQFLAEGRDPVPAAETKGLCSSCYIRSARMAEPQLPPSHTTRDKAPRTSCHR